MSGEVLFTVRIEDAGGTLRATAVGELDLLTEPELLDAFVGALDATTSTTSVLDLRQVGFMDSSGLRGVLLCREAARARGLSFSLAVDQGPVTRLFDVAGVRDWFTYDRTG